MATIEPTDPRQLLEDAANNVSAFRTVEQDKMHTEMGSDDLPSWALDPREQERDHEAQTTNMRVYSGVPTEMIFYIAVEAGSTPADRETARDSLDTHRNSFFDALYQTVLPNNNEDGRIGKTGRVRSLLEHGERMLMYDAVSVLVTQDQEFNA